MATQLRRPSQARCPRPEPSAFPAALWAPLSVNERAGFADVLSDEDVSPEPRRVRRRPMAWGSSAAVPVWLRFDPPSPPLLVAGHIQLQALATALSCSAGAAAGAARSSLGASPLGRGG